MKHVIENAQGLGIGCPVAYKEWTEPEEERGDTSERANKIDIIRAKRSCNFPSFMENESFVQPPPPPRQSEGRSGQIISMFILVGSNLIADYVQTLTSLDW